jgi:hypothetical protein
MKTIALIQTRFHSHLLKAVVVAIAFSVSSPRLSAENVRLYFDSKNPQIAFAAGDVKTALEKRKHTVQVQELRTLRKSDSGKKIILALASDQEIAATMLESGGKPIGELGAQAYSLKTTTRIDPTHWVLGGDANGAMYGGLQLAENIQFNDLAKEYNVGRGIADLLSRLQGHIAPIGRQGCLGDEILEDVVRRDGPPSV